MLVALGVVDLKLIALVVELLYHGVGQNRELLVGGRGNGERIAQSGDAVTLDILTKNMHRLALGAAKLITTSPEANRVGLYGGIFQHSELARTIFSKSLLALSPDAVICSPDYPPELGAIIHLFKKNGTLTDEVLRRMKSSYQEVRNERN